ncbi:MAG: hypothetical protein M3N19_11880 [Candidatus Eremiobacteraeota bacterium]|nr:hypothetical protein [Candidatus Eremiobacteraeota bacterium]
MVVKMLLREIRHAWQRIVSPRCINAYERRIFSQNGEDGILREIFARAGVTNKFFVEFGVEDGTECNTALLARRAGWKGVMIEGSPQKHAQLDRTYAPYPQVKRLHAFITRENIVQLFEQATVPKDLDLLSIDIDGNDYWIWEALAEYHPRVVVIEYNATRPPPERWVISYNPAHRWNEDGYMGASLSSLQALGTRLGYALVGTDEKGVNAFFIRNDVLAASRFPELSPVQAYHRNDYGLQRADGPHEVI